MAEEMHYEEERKDHVDPEQNVIEVKAKSDNEEVSSGPESKMIDSVKQVDAESTEVEKQEEDEEHGRWGNKWDFLFSCISVSVGLGNVWRFPYLCHKHGGGAFLIIYGIAMIFCGIPLFFQELAVGQYLGSGGMMMAGQFCPLFRGLGYATMMMVFFLDVYYCIIISWTLFYLISTIVNIPELPWKGCDNWWNTENCYDGSENMKQSIIFASNSTNSSTLNSTVFNHTTPVEEYWERRVLGVSPSINEIGGIQWELFGCLVISWLVVYFIIRRGLRQGGKILWFSALFPYVVLFILLVRAVTLEGSYDGLLFYVTPRWEELRKSSAWVDAVTQTFFAYSIGTGVLPTLGSYNSFHHNFYRDAIITCIANTLTCLIAGVVTSSILGHIAFEQGTEISQVLQSGPGLVFLTYPEVILKLPGAAIWAIIFFIMLLILGIVSEICIVESFITGVVDNWPHLLRPHREKFTIAICFLMFCLGLPMVTNAGVYIFQLMDSFSATGVPLLATSFLQTAIIFWVFSTRKFCDLIHEMIGTRMNKFWYLSWTYFAPMIIIVALAFTVLDFDLLLTYGHGYKYPKWADLLARFFVIAATFWMPAYTVYDFLNTREPVLKKLLVVQEPVIKRRPKLPKVKKPSVIPMSKSSAGLITTTNSSLSEK